jgi:hypothetical protein
MFKTMGGRSLFAGQSFDVIEAPTAGPLVAEALGGVGHHDLVAQVIQPFTQEIPRLKRLEGMNLDNKANSAMVPKNDDNNQTIKLLGTYSNLTIPFWDQTVSYFEP